MLINALIAWCFFSFGYAIADIRKTEDLDATRLMILIICVLSPVLVPIIVGVNSFKWLIANPGD